MKKKQFLVACMPAVITLLIVLMNVLAENKVTTLYKRASAALEEQNYAAVETYLSQIEAIAPEYAPQYALSAERYLQRGQGNRQLAYQELERGIQNTGSKYLISLADRLAHGDTSLVETTGSPSLPQTRPEEWSAAPSQATTPQQNNTAVLYTTMNYDFIVRYPDSQMEDSVQLIAGEGLDSENWTWTSSNPTIASVDESGVVHCGNQVGEAKITAQSSRNRVAECWVCIIEPVIHYDNEFREYCYISEGNLYIQEQEEDWDDSENESPNIAQVWTETGSVTEFLPLNAVRGDSLVGAAEPTYTPPAVELPDADMVDENGFPIYKTSTPPPESTQQPSDTEGDTVSLELVLGWQSLYFSGEYRIPEHLRFNGKAVTPDSVTLSGNLAYITSLHIPASLTNVQMGYKNPFSDYPQLESITVEAGNPAYKTVDGALLTADGTELIAYPVASPETEFSIPEGVITIDPYAFSNNQNLTTLHIPASVTEFGQGTAACALNSITLDSGNTAFQVQDGMLMNSAGTEILTIAAAAVPENFTIPAQVASIHGELFTKNTRIKQLTVESTSLGDLDLNDFTGLETLVINGNVDWLRYRTSDESDANLQELTINGKVREVVFERGESSPIDRVGENMVVTLNTPVEKLDARGFSLKLVHPENVTTELGIRCFDSDAIPALSPTLQNITLYLCAQEISDLEFLRPCTSLESLILWHGSVKDLSALMDLPSLTSVRMYVYRLEGEASKQIVQTLQERGIDVYCG